MIEPFYGFFILSLTIENIGAFSTPKGKKVVSLLKGINVICVPRYQLLSQTSKTFQKDGLSTLEYDLVDVVQHHLYTHVIANIDEHSWWKYFAKLLFGDER